jgi:hypothetical protein
MSQREQFISEWRWQRMQQTALCAAFGISRQTGYKWAARFDEDRSIEERSRRPRWQPRRPRRSSSTECCPGSGSSRCGDRFPSALAWSSSGRIWPGLRRARSAPSSTSRLREATARASAGPSSTQGDSFDSGEPFGSVSTAAGLTKLSAWWARLGGRLERIDLGKPQQNGRHQRMHLTPKQARVSRRALRWLAAARVPPVSRALQGRTST